MKNFNNKGFSLVELLVVITILAIISVVAYQNFGWATDKAIASRKINDIWTIETALQQFKVDNNYYPMPLDYSNTNLWWYSGATATSSWKAYASNTIKVEYDNVAVKSLTWITEIKWGWVVYWTWTNAWKQIWAKWVIWIWENFSKKYLSKDLYDPELWDIVLTWDGNKKMFEYWIGRYVYWVYAQPKVPSTWNITKTSWSYYNIAITLKKKSWEWYESYVAWDFDNNSCIDSNACPKTLIWDGETYIENWKEGLWNATTESNQWIPYPITDFATN